MFRACSGSTTAEIRGWEKWWDPVVAASWESLRLRFKYGKNMALHTRAVPVLWSVKLCEIDPPRHHAAGGMWEKKEQTAKYWGEKNEGHGSVEVKYPHRKRTHRYNGQHGEKKGILQKKRNLELEPAKNSAPADACLHSARPISIELWIEK